MFVPERPQRKYVKLYAMHTAPLTSEPVFMPATRERVRQAFTSLGGDAKKVFAIVQFYGQQRPERGYTAGMTYSVAGGDSHGHGHAEAIMENEWQRILAQWDDTSFHDYRDTITRVDVTVKYSPCQPCVLKLLTIAQMTAQKVGNPVPMNVYYLAVYRGDPDGVGACSGMGIPCNAYEATDEGRWWRDEKVAYNELM
jgi:hypothetical protein